MLIAVSPSRRPDLQDWVAHAGWARQLAAHLVRDPEQADDLTQEALRRAVERGPRADGRDHNLRGWLRAVMHNLARSWKRDRELRAWHEERASRSEAWNASEVEERVKLQRRLAEAVLGLDEPYRSAIALRYFEELSAGAIARRLGISGATVRQRISRGLAMLRARLDREYGADRSAWCAVVLTFGRIGGLAGSLKSGGWIMGSSWKVAALAGVVLACSGAWWWQAIQPPRETRPLELQTAKSVRTALGETTGGYGSVEDAREAVLLSRSATTETAIDRDRDLHGVVTDPNGTPVEGAALAVYRRLGSGLSLGDSARANDRSEASRGSTDSQGRFAFALQPGVVYELEVSSSAYPLHWIRRCHAGEFLQVRLDRARTIFGRITRDVDGLPVADATVELWRVGDRAAFRKQLTTASGSFEFDGLCAGSWALQPIATADAPIETLTRYADLTAVEDLEVNIEVSVASVIRSIHGSVTDELTGAPIPGAEIRAWNRTAISDATGCYELSAPFVPHRLVVSAKCEGYTKQLHDLQGPSLDPFPDRLDFKLQISRRARGRIVDRDRVPIQGVYVAAIAAEIVRPNEWRRDCVSAFSGADGIFEIADLQPDLSHALVVQHPGKGTAVYDFPSTETRSPIVDLGDIVMGPMSIICGRVVDESGQGVAGQAVLLKGYNTDRARFRASSLDQLAILRGANEREGYADDLGRFRFAELSAGEYRLELVDHMGERPGIRSGTATVTLGESERTEELVFVLSGTLSIAGRVLDAAGRAVPRTEVILDNGRLLPGAYKRRETNAEGRFEFQRLTEGKYELCVHRSAMQAMARPRIHFPRRKLVGVEAGTTDLEIILGPAVQIRGRVLDPQGRPVKEAAVSATTARGESDTGCLTKPDGTFEIDLAPGEVADLLARPPESRNSLYGKTRGDPLFATKVLNVSPGEIEIRLSDVPLENPR